MPSGWYNRGVYEVASGGTDLDGATIKAMLLNTSHTFNRDHNVVSDIVANEITATGYARQTLGSKTVTEDDTADAAYWDAADVTFPAMNAGQTARYVVLFRDSGADATSPLLACWQIVDFATDGTSLNVPWSVLGLTKFWSST